MLKERNSIGLTARTYNRINAIRKEFGIPMSEIVESALEPALNGEIPVEVVLAQVAANRRAIRARIFAGNAS